MTETLPNPVLPEGGTLIDKLQHSSTPIATDGGDSITLTPQMVEAQEAQDRSNRQMRLKADGPEPTTLTGRIREMMGEPSQAPGQEPPKPADQVQSPPPEPSKPGEPPKPEQRRQAEPDWISNLRKENDSKGKDLAIAKEKVAELERVQAEKEELTVRLAETKAELAKHEKVASVAALEMSDDFQKKFVIDRAEIVENLKNLAVNNGLDAESLLNAIENPSRPERKAQLEQLWAGLSEFDKDDFKQGIRNIDAIDNNKTRALADAKTELQQTLSKRKLEESQKNEARTRASRDAWLSATVKAKDYGMDSETVKQAETFWNENHDKNQTAERILKGFAFDSREARIKELETTLAAYKGASPPVAAGAPASSGPAPQGMMAEMRSMGIIKGEYFANGRR